jgi:hypothetical protein
VVPRSKAENVIRYRASAALVRRRRDLFGAEPKVDQVSRQCLEQFHLQVRARVIRKRDLASWLVISRRASWIGSPHNDLLDEEIEEQVVREFAVKVEVKQLRRNRLHKALEELVRFERSDLEVRTA